VNRQPQPTSAPPINPIAFVVGFLRETWFNTRLSWRLIWDGRVRFRYKLIPPALILYGLSPLDLSTLLGVFFPPALLPGVSAIDDILVIKTGLEYFVGICPPDVVDEHLSALLPKLRDGA